MKVTAHLDEVYEDFYFEGENKGAGDMTIDIDDELWEEFSKAEDKFNELKNKVGERFRKAGRDSDLYPGI